jgi:Co/Zn/Cd efflux system component
MDCPSEENLIRLKLEGLTNINALDFDLSKRKLTVFHEGEPLAFEHLIFELNLGAKKISSEETNELKIESPEKQRKLLWIVLAINFAFFLIEITTGFISKSMGLVADSLDMLADALVYGMSLFAVGGAIIKKKRVALLAGYFQITLAAIGFLEVLRRFLGSEKIPDFSTMIFISFFALIANGLCLYLLQKSNNKEAHMQASLIFTSNDVIINLGVIVAGFLVFWLQSNKPDLIIGTIVFILVIIGGVRILKLGR